jgi:hypothetical protein
MKSNEKLLINLKMKTQMSTGMFPYPPWQRGAFSGGFAFDRQAAGSHEIWYNSKTDRTTTVPNHSGDMPEEKTGAMWLAAGRFTFS